MRDIGVGTYDAVYSAKPTDYLRDVLALMSSRGISAIPLLNESGKTRLLSLSLLPAEGNPIVRCLLGRTCRFSCRRVLSSGYYGPCSRVTIASVHIERAHCLPWPSCLCPSSLHETILSAALINPLAKFAKHNWSSRYRLRGGLCGVFNGRVWKAVLRRLVYSTGCWRLGT